MKSKVFISSRKVFVHLADCIIIQNLRVVFFYILKKRVFRYVVYWTLGFHNWEVKFYSLWEDIWSLKPIHAYGFFLLMLSILKYLRLNQCSNEMMSAFLLYGCLCSRKRERGMGFMTFGFRLGSLWGREKNERLL